MDNKNFTLQTQLGFLHGKRASAMTEYGGSSEHAALKFLARGSCLSDTQLVRSQYEKGSH